MEALIKKPSNIEPLVEFNKEQNKFVIRGTAISNNIREIFIEMTEWAKAYAHDPNPNTRLEIYLEYCNTASSKLLFEVIRSFKGCEANGNFSVLWQYDEYDDEMLFLGQTVHKLLGVDIQYKAIPE